MRRPACVLALLCAAGCTGLELPAVDPLISGTVVARGAWLSSPSEEASVHVKEALDDPCGIIFGVGSRTVVVRRNEDGRLERARLTDVAVGDSVRVWAGGLAESCPGQSYTEFIEIVAMREGHGT